MTERPSIICLEIVLDDVEPVVMRRIEVPATLRLDRLHTVLQIALGWTDSHLYEFPFQNTGFGILDPDWDLDDGLSDARRTTLIEAIGESGVRSFKYLYDFGDGWEHQIRIERMAAADPAHRYPRLIDATGRCPPEDVGGPWGYQEFLEAVADPDHEEHHELLYWCGDDCFDPNDVDKNAIERTLNALALR